jgi:hypothetical protein
MVNARTHTVFERRDGQWFAARANNTGGVWLEGERHHRQFDLATSQDGPIQDGGVAAMHSVENSDGDDRTGPVDRYLGQCVPTQQGILQFGPISLPDPSPSVTTCKDDQIRQLAGLLFAKA